MSKPQPKAAPEGQVSAEELLGGGAAAAEPLLPPDLTPEDLLDKTPVDSEQTVTMGDLLELTNRMKQLERENGVMREALLTQGEYQKGLEVPVPTNVALAQLKAPKWFMNSEGRVMPATAMLIKHQKKMGLVSCAAPAEE